MLNIAQARNYINDLELPAARPVAQDSGPTSQVVFDDTKQQALVVGSQVLSFMPGISDDLRAALSDSALLGQLAADKKVGDPTLVEKWYDAYFAVLRNVGWVVQDTGFSRYTERGDGFEVHEAIMDVAGVLLGPIPGALAVVTATLNALKKVGENNKWITLFDKQSIHASAARFQITLVHSEGDGTFAEMMAFAINAKRTITQVLFFKVQTDEAELRKYSAKLSVNAGSVTALRDDIDARVRAFQKDYVASIDL